MIKKFETYINEDYFSKLANRKDNGAKRKENEITEEIVMEYLNDKCARPSVSLRKENGKTVVDIDGNFILRKDTKEIPFQFGKVTGYFNCEFCTKLTSLKGCPQEVGGYFSCYSCTNLTSLEGCPQEVGGNFNCEYCIKLTSLEGCPQEAGIRFYCAHCGGQFTEEEIRKICNVKGTVICN